MSLHTRTANGSASDNKRLARARALAACGMLSLPGGVKNRRGEITFVH